MRKGPRNLITDVEGLLVGNAEDPGLKSGTTVLTAAEPFTASAFVMGGAPGTRETDLLAPDKSVAAVDAIVLSGGSAFGLAAAEGVMAGLREARRGFPVGPARVPIVPAAILFDLLNGGRKDWSENPYPLLGRAALAAAGEDFGLGTAGAGTGALAGDCKGGLGSASAVLESGHTVGALVAVNPVGNVTVPGGRRFWAAPFELDGEFGGLGPDPRGGLGAPSPSPKMAAFAARFGPGEDGATEGGNTTIAIVATDAALTKAEAHRVAQVAHDGMARAIVPAHTPADGDIVFAVSTGRRHLPPDALWMIGHAASMCLARAIARAAYHARPEPGDLLPAWSLLHDAGAAGQA